MDHLGVAKFIFEATETWIDHRKLQREFSSREVSLRNLSGLHV